MAANNLLCDICIRFIGVPPDHVPGSLVLGTVLHNNSWFGIEIHGPCPSSVGGKVADLLGRPFSQDQDVDDDEGPKPIECLVNSPQGSSSSGGADSRVAVTGPLCPRVKHREEDIIGLLQQSFLRFSGDMHAELSSSCM